MGEQGWVREQSFGRHNARCLRAAQVIDHVRHALNIPVGEDWDLDAFHHSLYRIQILCVRRELCDRRATERRQTRRPAACSSTLYITSGLRRTSGACKHNGALAIRGKLGTYSRALATILYAAAGPAVDC